MGRYRIIRTTTVKFDNYVDVLLVVTRKEKGFIASLFSSGETQFILSKESPLAREVQNRASDVLLEIDESLFKPSTLNYKTYLVELKIDQYETAKNHRVELEKKEREAKAKKEREEKEAADKKRKAEEEEHRLLEALKNAKVQKIPFSSLQMVVDENDDFSTQMAAIAGNVNLSYATGNKQGLQNNLIELYNRVHGYNSHKLKTIKGSDGQTVGLAFIKMALFFNNGDFQVNEIAAQNAFYCIVKNFKEKKNTYALPALFSLLLKKPRALEDELYRANPDPSLVGLGGLTPSAPYVRRDRAMSNRLPIMIFLLQRFYDKDQKKFLIDTTLPYHIPSANEVANFLNDYNKSEYASKANSISIGEEYLNDMYEDIEGQLDL